MYMYSFNYLSTLQNFYTSFSGVLEIFLFMCELCLKDKFKSYFKHHIEALSQPCGSE